MIDLSRGACAGMADETFAEDDIFYREPQRGRPTKTDPYAAAKALCSRCPIRDLCLQDALTEPVQWGFRAGLTPEQRQPLVPSQPVRRYNPSSVDLTNRVRMWEAGMDDQAIADAQGLSRQSIKMWRHVHGYASNNARDPRTVHSPEQNLLKMRLWESGATDREIADAIPCRTDGVRKWRAKHGLKPNPAREQIAVSA